MKEVRTKSLREKVSKVRKIMLSAGNHLVAASFVKRSDGTKRKVVGRLHVRKPTYVRAPSGKKVSKGHNLITIFDMNVLKYNRLGKLNGRGGWKSIPLDGVYRIKTGGTVYHMV